MNALVVTSAPHFLMLNKTGSSKIVYPVHEMGEARSDAIIPREEIYSSCPVPLGLPCLDMTSNAATAKTLNATPVFISLNLAVNPKIELFPGMINVSIRRVDAASHCE